MYVLYLNRLNSNPGKFVPVVSAKTKTLIEELLVRELLSAPVEEDGAIRYFKKGLLRDYKAPTINGVNTHGSYEGIVRGVSREDLKQEYLEEMEDALTAYDEAFEDVLVIG